MHRYLKKIAKKSSLPSSSKSDTPVCNSWLHYWSQRCWSSRHELNWLVKRMKDKN